jgi:hypothetical protein
MVDLLQICSEGLPVYAVPVHCKKHLQGTKALYMLSKHCYSSQRHHLREGSTKRKDTVLLRGRTDEGNDVDDTCMARKYVAPTRDTR